MPDEATLAKRVMVVDDEPGVLIYLTALFEDNGYETRGVEDARLAMETAREFHPDLICLDVVMPRQSGLSLFKEFRQSADTSQTPVIFISAIAQTRDAGVARLLDDLKETEDIAGPEAYFEKPIKPDELIDAVAAALGAK